MNNNNNLTETNNEKVSVLLEQNIISQDFVKLVFVYDYINERFPLFSDNNLLNPEIELIDLIKKYKKSDKSLSNGFKTILDFLYILDIEYYENFGIEIQTQFESFNLTDEQKKQFMNEYESFYYTIELLKDNDLLQTEQVGE